MGKNIGIDLGTANTLIYVRDRGIVLREPTVAAVQTKTTRVIAAGNAARQMLGKTPGSLTALRPVRNGVIADFDITAQMLRMYYKSVGGMTFFSHPKVAICIPHGITDVEKRAVSDVALEAGASSASLVDEPLAAAIGSGLLVNEPRGTMLVDIGGGTTEVAVLSLNGIVKSTSIRTAGNEMDNAIIEYVKQRYNALIGEVTAEALKRRVGSAHPDADSPQMTVVSARNLRSGLPVNIRLGSREIRSAILPELQKIVNAIRTTLENTPPELSADIYDRGIMMTGGGALLPGFDKLISYKTGLRAVVAKNPLDCVINGIGIMMQNTSESWTDRFNLRIG